MVNFMVFLETNITSTDLIFSFYQDGLVETHDIEEHTNCYYIDQNYG